MDWIDLGSGVFRIRVFIFLERAKQIQKEIERELGIVNGGERGKVREDGERQR